MSHIPRFHDCSPAHKLRELRIVLRRNLLRSFFKEIAERRSPCSSYVGINGKFCPNMPGGATN